MEAQVGRATASEGLGTVTLSVLSTGVRAPPAEPFLLLGGVFITLAEPLLLEQGVTLLCFGEALYSAAACLKCLAAASVEAALSAAEGSATNCCAMGVQLPSAAVACFSSNSLKLAATAAWPLRGVSVLS
jgi:hypothetical protein